MGINDDDAVPDLRHFLLKELADKLRMSAAYADTGSLGSGLNIKYVNFESVSVSVFLTGNHL